MTVEIHNHDWQDSGRDRKNGATVYECSGCPETLDGFTNRERANGC